MPRVRSGDLTIVIVACSALAVLTAAGAAATATSGPAIRGSSFSAAPGGAKAAFLTLKQLGYVAERSYEPLTAITAEPARTTLVLASPLEGPSAMDRRALEAFVAAGGRVLATGSVGARFLGGRAPTPASAVADDPRSYPAVSPGVLTTDAPSITMSPEVTDVLLNDTYHAVYGSPTEAVVRQASRGRGLAVWWAASTPLTNAAIRDDGNLALLLNSLGEPGRTVLWDEHYHGHSRTLWSYIAATPLPWAGAQLALIALAAALAFSRRHGPVRGVVEDPRTSTMEFVDTMGGLYERAGAASAAVAAARLRLRRVLTAASGLPPDADDNRLAAAAAPRVGVDAGEMADLLDATRTVEADNALSSVQRLQTMTARASARAGRQGGR